MNNTIFLNEITKMYNTYLQTHRRSSAKLTNIHGSIANDLQQRLGNQYKVHSLGFNEGKEKEITGRYINKKADISIFKKINNNKLEEIGGIAFKSIMTNYAQNSNNYFENMLGETANIRANNKCYFQVLIIPETLPYFGEVKKKNLKDVVVKNEILTSNHLQKYIKLSNDTPAADKQSPDLMLLYLIKTCNTPIPINPITNNPSRKDWIDYMQQNLNIQLSTQAFNFGPTLIYNNYQDFISKVVQQVLSM